MTLAPHPEWQWRWLHNGLILPWFTKPCLEWLVQQDLRQKTVLEWGIGVDIPWWCANSKTFIGIEHDPGTGKDHQNVKPASNAVLVYAGVDAAVEDDADTECNYVRAASAMATVYEPEIVVIDGIYRVGCAAAAMWMRDLEVNTVIVDNADWPGLQRIREMFGELGWHRTSYVQPDHAEGWTTDVWEVR